MNCDKKETGQFPLKGIHGGSMRGIEDNSKIIFLYFSTKTYVVTDYSLESSQLIPMMGHKVCFYGKIWIIIPDLSQLASLSGASSPHDQGISRGDFMHREGKCM